MNKKLVLIVEDDRSIRYVLEKILKYEGLEVDSVGNGEEAMAWLNASLRTPDLIFLDLMMPIMSGWEFMHLQRADDRLRSIPVVVMSADMSATVNSSETCGKSFLKKPIELGTLMETVKSMIV
ncbi:MAG: response regulator [Bdellovibrionota bacterium]